MIKDIKQLNIYILYQFKKQQSILNIFKTFPIRQEKP